MQAFLNRVAAGVALVVFATSSFAADAPAKSTAQGEVAKAQGVRAYIDPQSGELVDRPVTPEQRAVEEQTNAAFSQSDAGLVQVVHADGSVSVDLQGRFEQAVTLMRTADGKLVSTCNDAAHAASGPHSHAADGKPVAAPRDDR